VNPTGRAAVVLGGTVVTGWLVFAWLIPGFQAPHGVPAAAPTTEVGTIVVLPESASAADVPADLPTADADADADAAVASVAAIVPIVGNAMLVDPAWAAAVAASTGIPLRAVLGYAGASLALSVERPSCRLGWSSLAALGWIESDHGTTGGRSLPDTGQATPPIFGPSLDGAAYETMADTDDGLWDGSALGDRAVGPMQFIPATWLRWGADGDGNGVKDPQQIDDAALAAGRYLCHYGDLADSTKWRSAVYAYNHVDSYVDAVAERANAYTGLAG
jgi:membrane-bound lytic murein transglycosylase B